MPMKAHATCKICFPNTDLLDVVFEALEPEAHKPATKRSKASLSKAGTCLVLIVESRDTVALRATLNAYLRWIDSVTKVLCVLGKC